MLCKIEARKRARKIRETVASENTNSRKKTKYACIVEAHGSTTKRVESTLPRNHEDHMTEKRVQVDNSLQLGAQIYSLA